MLRTAFHHFFLTLFCEEWVKVINYIIDNYATRHFQILFENLHACIDKVEINFGLSRWTGPRSTVLRFVWRLLVYIRRFLISPRIRCVIICSFDSIYQRRLLYLVVSRCHSLPHWRLRIQPTFRSPMALLLQIFDRVPVQVLNNLCLKFLAKRA